MRSRLNFRCLLITPSVGGLTGAILTLRILASVVVVGVMGVTFFSAVPAQAAQIHRLLKSFTLAGGGARPLELAINESTGEVYASSIASGAVFAFKADGSEDPTHPKLTDADGTTPYPFVSPYGVAVDNSGGPDEGDIYVADNGAGEVIQFSPSGTRTAQAPIAVVDVPKAGTSQESHGLSPVVNNGNFSLADVAVGPNSDIYVIDQNNNVVDVFEPDGSFVEQIGGGGLGGAYLYSLAVDSQNNLFVSEYGVGVIELNSSFGCVDSCAPIGGGSLGVATDAEGDIFNDEVSTVGEFNSSDEKIDSFGSLSFGRGIAVSNTSGDVYVADEDSNQVDVFEPITVPTVTTDQITNPKQTSVELTGEVDPDAAHGGGPVTDCQFKYGTEPGSYNLPPLPCLNSEGHEVGTVEHPIESATQVHAELTGLTVAMTYHFILFAEDAHGPNSSPDKSFETLAAAPLIKDLTSSDVHSESAEIHAEINPGGSDTTYHFEYGTDASYGTSEPIPDADIGSGRTFQSVEAQLTGLAPSTTYHYRVVATNSAKTTDGPDQTFTTFPFVSKLNEGCPNSLARQQTGASLLLDCRAYELVSAPNTGGYDVESDLTSGQTPYSGYPDAQNRVLYGVHDGGIPGTDHPTNNGVDPYVATRGKSGWSTEYVGVPANDPFAVGSFSSVPSGASAGLETFAFGASGGCSPCFEGGYTGIPIRLANGELVQGMTGSLNPGPSAKPAGLITEDLSANGEHFVFGSTSQFEPEGNKNGEISIYDRDLKSGETHVVSFTPAAEDPPGQPLPCEMNCATDGIAELGISADGSHILLGQLVKEAEGAKLYHLYMNVGDSIRTIDLTPGASEGVRFDGMTSDGKKVFFSSTEHLTSEDEQHSGADIYMWEEGQPLTLVSSGTEGDASTCDPAANTEHVHWNTNGSEENCGDVAIGGGGGVASGDGTFYFLSPSLLDGSEEPTDGVKNAPNLYVVRPGQTARLVATLESALTGPPAQTRQLPLRSFGSFANPDFVAVSPVDGDVYVADSATRAVYKFDSAGNAVTGWRENGKLTFGQYPPVISGIAVGPSGNLYVEFVEGGVSEFSPSGSSLNGISSYGDRGITVDAAGNVYLYSGFSGSVLKFNSAGEEVGTLISHISATGLAVDPSNGDIYVDIEGKAVERYSFNGAGEVIATKVIATELSGATGLAVDPTLHHVYVDEGSQVLVFDSSGNEVSAPIGTGLLHGSKGVAVGLNGELYAGNPGHSNITEFGLPEPNPDPKLDNPAVVDAIREPEARRSADFQLTPSGQFAVFNSTLSLTDAENAGYSEVYRYSAAIETLNCASCDPANAEATGAASLAVNGSSLTEAGQVFFNSGQALTLGDTDNREDVYEWEPQGVGSCGSESPAFSKTSGDCLSLVSTGSSPFDSSLLGVSADGVNAYFFTHDKLAPQDENGELVKIYDARENGGFFVIPEPPPCKASDECHGAGTAPPPPPDFDVNPGTTGNGAPAATKHCRKGFVLRHETCIKKSHRRKQKHRRRAAHHRRGGGK